MTSNLNQGDEQAAQDDAEGRGRFAAEDIRQRIQSAVGQVVLAMIGVPRYRHSSIADLEQLVLEPLLRDRIAIASSKAKEGGDVIDGALAGIAIWASVSEAVEQKIREEIKAGVFPIRLKPHEWASGDRVWLFDVIAPSRQMASTVLANFKQVVKEGEVHIHPMVARMVDPELLKKMGAVSEGPASSLATAEAGGTA
jgi:cytolysin-activating lysine-acyltransferase